MWDSSPSPWDVDLAFAEEMWAWGVWLRWPAALVLLVSLFVCATLAQQGQKRSLQLQWVLRMERIMRVTGYIIVGPSFWLLCRSWSGLRRDEYWKAGRFFSLFVFAHERERLVTFDLTSWWSKSSPPTWPLKAE